MLEAAYRYAYLDMETAKAYPENVKGFLKKKFLKKQGSKYIITERGKNAWKQYRATGVIWLAPARLV